MTTKREKDEQSVNRQLRIDAEDRLGGHACIGTGTSADELLHELQVHKIELEMQNEALRQAQISLAQSRDRYLDLYDFSPVGYLTLSALGLVDEANLTFAGWLAEERATLIGKPLSLFIASDYKDRWHSILRGIRQADRLEIAEICLQRRDGQRFFAKLDCLCLHGNGAAATIRISINNLGALSMAERNFIDGENRYRALYESMRDAFALVDMSGKIVLSNKPYQEMMGYSAKALKSKTDAELTPEKWHFFETQLIDQEVMRDGESCIYEKEYIRKDGTVFPVELKMVLVKDKQGQPSGMWAVVRDISARKRAEAELAESESRFRLAMQAIASVVYDWDMVGDDAYFSDGVLNLLGEPFSGPKAVHGWWAKRLHPEDYHRVRAHVVQSLKIRAERFEATYRMRHKSGRWVHISDCGLIIYGADGRGIRLVGSLTDISAQVVAETALRRLNDSLEEQVLERSAELRCRVQELHDSERFIRATLDAMTSAVCVINVNGEVIFANKAWLEVPPNRSCAALPAAESTSNYSPYCSGCPEINKPCFPNERIAAAVGSILTGKRKSFSLEYECDSALSAPRSVLAKLSRFKGDGPVRLVLSHEDITERKLAANEVSRVAKSFKAMLRKAELTHEAHSKQIAREVHDQLGATLTMLKLGLATTMSNAALAEPIQARIKGMIDLADMALKSVKSVTASLRPSMLDTLGLVAAINWHAKEFARMTGIETEVKAANHIKFSAERGESIFRIIQEALTNVAKHANASKATVVLRRTKRNLIVTVSDNGTGLKVGSLDRQDSFGVIGMRERANYLNGSVSLGSQPAGGTRLTLNIPLEMDHGGL